MIGQIYKLPNGQEAEHVQTYVSKRSVTRWKMQYRENGIMKSKIYKKMELVK